MTEKDHIQKYLDVAGVMLLSFGKDLKVRMVNKEGCRVLGNEQQEIMGKDWRDSFVPEDARESVRAVLAELIQGKLTGPSITRIRCLREQRVSGR